MHHVHQETPRGVGGRRRRPGRRCPRGLGKRRDNSSSVDRAVQLRGHQRCHRLRVVLGHSRKPSFDRPFI
jgi:hypothetical protein